MVKNQLPKWLTWGREIQAISQTGLAYVENEFDIQRYQRLQEISAEIISEYTGLGVSELVQDFNAQMGYATPKVDLRGAVFRDRKLLMVNEKADGSWAMPGGWADVGDVPSSGTEREILEETGIIARAIKLIGVYDNNRVGDLRIHHAFKLVFLCEYLEGEPTPSNETLDVQYFERNEIPDQLLGTRTTVRQIEDAYAALADNKIAAVFD
ncbi:MAG: NUDIX domain-containing protein [Chloroflexi bacterium]|jgi:ADP-ribose pyrophosphatase YjhB (NUDIX family)|nr:NUDIX domain-containing protein [Chloroflexota bacterium]MBT3670744.1 NUDIX domain-containing protein [Chloroflexota bacterium]MBT4003866.1 NUDIX domain-containing protein [Chloroflexota bacterium]MBT4305112.1 NUDIX domain-containing protein [Chloroflexota bacterium]MBT4533366.1 NUDIX domain-containing protein [Chloroflexota bacterium]